jgi:uncharacterized protein (DUF1015 family)
MSLLRPFRAYRPRPELARDVASFPYDVISSDEARELARGNPRSFLHVVKPEIDLDPSVSLYDDRVYATGRRNLQRFIEDGTLVRETAPCLYVYQQRMGGHVQAGLVGLCSVAEYERDLIRKHEHTRKDKEDDRTRHVTECNANAEPVFLTYRACREIDTIVNRASSRPPTYDFVATDWIGHALWVVSDGAELEALSGLFRKVPCLYVADGHHRTAAAVRHGRMMRARSAAPRGDEPYESFMAVVFPHDQVRILDYNRVVKDLNGLGADEFLVRVGERFIVTVSEPSASGRYGTATARTPADTDQAGQGTAFGKGSEVSRPEESVGVGRHEGNPPGATVPAMGGQACVAPRAPASKPDAPLRFGMFLQGRWYGLEAKPGTWAADDPVRRLDVSILQENLLAPVLGVADPRTDRRIDFVGGIRGMAGLEKRCREGWAVAFALHPTSLDQLMEVADAGLIMPPKSTWFEPKLRSGLTVRLLDE